MKISLQRLKQGLTEIDESVEPAFLDDTYRANYPDTFQVHVRVDKFDRDYRVSITLNTSAKFTCDRCLEDYREPWELFTERIFRVSAEDTDDDDIIQLSSDATELEVDPFLREMLILEHPIKKLCKENCKGLCPGCGVNLNKEECRCTDEEIDPRWEELKKLIK